jgi:hypothetical protein
MEVVNNIKNSMELDVRTSTEEREYFEAVFQNKDLNTLSSLLKDTMGEPLKPPGKNVRFPKHVQKLVDAVGGLRREQSFYLKEGQNGEYTYAALWPWQSDPSKITLKIGRGNFSSL